MEYISAPMLQPTTAILKFEPLAFNSTRRRISSSSGRFRKKKVPVYCPRFERLLASLWKNVPYEEMSPEFRNPEGSRFHTHLFKTQIHSNRRPLSHGQPNFVVKYHLCACCVA